MVQTVGSYAVRLTPDADSISASKNYAGVLTRLLGDFVASAQWENADRGSADELYDVKIQHSPDPADITDANALWYDLVTFTQVAATSGSEAKNVTSPHFSRMRAVATLAGTTPSGDLTVIIEGVQLG